MIPIHPRLADMANGVLAEGISLTVLGLCMAFSGHVLRFRAALSGRRSRWRWSAAAIALGYFIVAGGLVSAATYWVHLRRASGWDSLDGTLFQERRIYNACQAFSSVRGRLPSTLEDLVPDFLDDRRSLMDPQHPEAGEIGYHYYGSGSSGLEPGTSIFIASKAERQGARAVIYFSGKSGFTPASALPVIR